ncbi:MAG: hypothetical protein JW751_14240 [Polyangiaceae bacterium]|nr:hypothetical protein [Polyangiaceae bacterium]
MGTPANSPSFLPAEPKAGSRFATETAWRLAGSFDPEALEELALGEGASGLLEGAELGGTTGRIALAALPHAPDAEAVIGEVCGWLTVAEPEDAGLLLAAAHGVLARPPHGNERYDAVGVASCTVALGAASVRGDLDPQHRDLGVSALAMLRAAAPRPVEKGLSSAP